MTNYCKYANISFHTVNTANNQQKVADKIKCQSDLISLGKL